ncbi:metallophosphoesterase family protein [Cohnella terricola]|uniref:Metallophosphoesterase n=1 Tax=Cohnella terricola TaxID=1289167 RepID=A0A559JNA2_9BACL|nr:metallophosphoesterase [Cohnella terricola]TVY01365.1 metallophosphoesterase [Cohnella terricola]
MKLAIIGDLHYPDELLSQAQSTKEARDAFYSYFLDRFLSIEADYYISIGDLAHLGEFSEFKYVLNQLQDRQLQDRFLHALGNHDTFTYSKTDILTLTRQPRFTLIEQPDAFLLVLDTAREIREDWSGTMDDEQLVWLSEQLDRPANKPLLVFAHHPPHGTTARSTETMMSLDPTLDIWPILKRWKGFGFYFNGHNHVHSIVRREQWHFIQTAAVPDAPAVRVVCVEDGELRMETIDLSNTETTEWASLFTADMYDYEILPEANGDSTSASLRVELGQPTEKDGDAE